MKALSEAKQILMKEKQKLEQARSSFDTKIYQLEMAIEAMENTEALKKTRRVRWPKVCPACNEKFFAGKETTVFCTKRECRNAANRAKRKGITLIAGEKK